LPGTGRTSRLATLSALFAGAALLAAACAPTSNPPNFPISTSGAKFLTFVPDSLNDAGRAASVVLDKDGNPVVSYLMLKAVLGKTDIPPAIKPGEPQPPAVMLASLSDKGLWSRTSVTPQLTAPEQGDTAAKLLGSATEIANDKGQPLSGVGTDLALDGNGKHHVVWSTPTGVFYATDAGGSFSKDTVTKDPAVGASVAVAGDGTPSVSYITAKGIQVSTKAGGAWKAEEVSAFSANLEDAVGLGTVIRLATDGKPIVAFGDGTKTKLARGAGGGWSVETVPGSGGLFVSLALDKSGNPHVAFYDPNGGVHHAHSVGGAPWTVTDLGTVQSGANATGAQAGWGTGIGLDDEGVHYVTWADTAKNEIELATNAGGEFAARPVPNSLGGQTPSIGVSGDGKKLAVAWFDGLNKNLDVATAVSGSTSLALAFSPAPAASGSAQPTATGSAAACQPEGGTDLAIAAPVGAAASGFDKKCLAVASGGAFTVAFKNDDQTVHNFVIYTTDPFPNPPTADQRLGGADTNAQVPAGSSQTYDVKALDPGTYFFRCDFHPTTMTGTFVVAK
jgi:plastocyanin